MPTLYSRGVQPVARIKVLSGPHSIFGTSLSRQFWQKSKTDLMLRPLFSCFFSNFRDRYDFRTKSGKSETDFRRGPCFFRDHYDFVRKSKKSDTDFSEDLFFEITMNFEQKVGCFVCLVHQYF